MPALRVRPMQPSDLEACAAVELQSYPSTVVEGQALFRRELHNYPEGCLVAADDGENVAGYAVSMSARMSDCPLELNASEELRRPLASDDDPTLYLHDLAVAANARRAGVGALLLQSVLEVARAAGLPRVTLTAVCGADSYWESHGFERMAAPSAEALARLRSYPAECGDACMMQLSLAQPQSAGGARVATQHARSMNCHLDPAKKERWHTAANGLVEQLEAMAARAAARRGADGDTGG